MIFWCCSHKIQKVELDESVRCWIVAQQIQILKIWSRVRNRVEWLLHPFCWYLLGTERSVWRHFFVFFCYLFLCGVFMLFQPERIGVRCFDWFDFLFVMCCMFSVRWLSFCVFVIVWWIDFVFMLLLCCILSFVALSLCVCCVCVPDYFRLRIFWWELFCVSD